MTDSNYVRALVIACMAFWASCAGGADDDELFAQVNLVDMRELALSVSAVSAINGSYTTCASRTGNWSLPVTGNPTLDYSALSVIKGNTACTLALTEITTTGGKLASSTPITLGTGYGSAQAFGSPVLYYANANLSSVAFTSDFTLTLLLSDDPRVGTASSMASYAVVNGTAATLGVTAPNYTIDMSGISITADFLKISQVISGNVVLTAGSTTGDF
jgi:hypothetical protein